MESLLRWQEGGSGFELRETTSELIVLATSGEQSHELARLPRGIITTVIEMHTPSGCELRILVEDGDPISISCPPKVCGVLLVKLRRFQGGTLQVLTPDGEHLVDAGK